ncbi:MAG TPA: class I SAM-dependent methyltransferase [Urbifossiella sp.]|nr:class I SAM-dependent methyltransferase [Urbifossiella sp.]
MSTCRICRRDGVRDWLDFGPQPLTNRYLRSAAEPEFTHQLALGVCRACGTLQLASAVPAEELRPRFDWVAYNEPERHLDEVASTVRGLPGVTPDSVVGAVTRMDDSALRRLAALGLPKIWRADPADLGLAAGVTGTESVQAAFGPAAADRLAGRHGRPDVLLARHLLEHSDDVHRTLAAARGLVRPGGYVVFEMPDVRKALERGDYTGVWEEHQTYFTPATLRQLLAAGGFEVVSLTRHYYPQEDMLVAVARPGAGAAGALSDRELAFEVERADRYVRGFSRVRDRVRDAVAGHARGGRGVAALGAGHVCAAFINLYGLADVFDFVADDDPRKQGLFMPGSRLPVRPSADLVARGTGLCLMTVRSEIEAAVAAKNATFTTRGGVLASVFPDSPYALGRPAGKAA